MIEGLRIGICGSAGVGKTTLVEALANALRLPRLREEMRDYLVRTGVDLHLLPPAEIELILMQLWRERRQKEHRTAAFIADNCALDFAAYSLYYGCRSGSLLDVTLINLARYDAVIVLPGGVLPYEQDGIRPADPATQVRYQSVLEDLLRRYMPAHKVHFLPPSVVRLQDRVEWVTGRLEKPTKSMLDDRRILVARARPGASKITGSLRSLGAEVVESPSIQSAPLEDFTQLDRSLDDLPDFDSVVLGCASGTHAFAERLSAQDRHRVLSQAICIGDQAAETMRGLTITPAAVLPGSCAKALTQRSELFVARRLLLITSNEGRPQLERELRKLRARVHPVAAYRIVRGVEAASENDGPFDLVILPSSSAARNVYTSQRGINLLSTPAIAIGPRTAKVARQYGAGRITCAANDDVDSVLALAVRMLSEVHPVTRFSGQDAALEHAR